MGTADERSTDVKRKRDRRSEAARIVIPDCVDLQRRERALADPELFLKTYFANRYRRPFGKHHYKMIEVIHERAQNGGRQAIAAPRGCGKSELVKGMLVFLVLAELVRFPLPMAATTKHAHKLYRDFQKKIATNDLLLADFPEVCYPVRALEGAPQRAAKQHIDGKLTEIVWTTQEYLSLPIVHSDNAFCKTYGGVKMSFVGLDAAFRGANIDGDRPDFILIDDPETRESAKSIGQIDDRLDILDKDIAGLAGEDEELSIAVLTTVQNCYCASFQLTDREERPAFNGLRYGMFEKWPQRMDLWDEYIALRRKAMAEGDKYGIPAIDFYLQNKGVMDAGAELLTEFFTPRRIPGVQLTHSNLQVQFDKIADTSMSAYRSEYQNDPEPEEENERSTLTIGKVCNTTSGYQQGEQPLEAEYNFLGIDIGKYTSHWVKIACDLRATTWVTDYGIIETHGLSKHSTEQAIDNALIDALTEFSESSVCTTESPLISLVDSGDFTESIYEFVHRAGLPFFSSKGVPSDKFRQKKKNDEFEPHLESYGHNTVDSKQRKIHLCIVNTDYWKNWAHDRYLVKTFVDQTRVPGSLAIFEPPMGDIRFHSQFGRHMVSEGLELVPVTNKAFKKMWIVHDRKNNHWLDALALACAAAGVAGIRLVQSEEKPISVSPQPVNEHIQKRFTNPWGQNFVATER